MPIKCRYCDGYRFENNDLWHYLFDDDPLCMNCRKSLMLKKRKMPLKTVVIRPIGGESGSVNSSDTDIVIARSSMSLEMRWTALLVLLIDNHR